MKAFSRNFLLGIVALGLVSCASPEEKAQAHLERGLELLESEDYTKASLEFRNAVKFNEKLAEAWLGLSRVLEHESNWRGMYSALSKVLELEPNHFDANLRIAKLDMMGGNIQQALERLNKTNELKKDDTDVLAARATVLLKLNDRVGARADADRALALNPDNPDAHAVLAADRMQDGDTKNALLFIDRGLATDEKNLALLLFKMKIFEQENNDAETEKVLRQIIAYYPDQTSYRRALISFLGSRKRLDEAEREMRELVETEPDKPETAFDLVRFIASVKDVNAARAELEALIKSKPQVVDYRLALARLDFEQKRVDEATTTLDDIITKGEPKDDVIKARLALAQMKLALADKDAASKLIQEILVDDEKNADALALRASIRLDNNDTDNAIVDLREALNQNPESVAFTTLLGRAYEVQGALALAEDQYTKAVKLTNYAPAVTLYFASFLDRRGSPKQAEEVLSEAVTRSPNNRQLLTALAQVRLKIQDWAGAEQVADALKKLGDTSDLAEEIVGAAQLGSGKFDQSIATFKGLLEKSNNASQPMTRVVRAYLAAGKVDDAKAFVQSVLDANPNNGDAHVLLGSIAAFEKKPGEAEAAFKRAIEVQPDSPNGYSALSQHYTASGKSELAEQVIRQGLEQIPGDFGLSMMLANTLEQKFDFEGAIAVYEDLLAKAPDALIVANNLASLLADHRSDTASLERANAVSRRLQSSNTPFFKDTLGWIAYRRGEYRAALSYLEEAKEKLDDNNLVRYHLGMTFAALERRDDARRELAKALELTRKDDPMRKTIESAIADLPQPATAN